MTDMMRDMINQLMGVQRAEEEGRSLPPYNHHSVCRSFLYGYCPFEILQDTRLDSLVMCRKLHEPAHKADYHAAQEKKDHFYDIDAFDALSSAIRNVDGEINKIKMKIERDAKEATDSVEFIKVTQKIHEVNEKIGQTLATMEQLGSEGKVEESIDISRNVEELKIKKRELENELRSLSGANLANNSQRLRVCEDCGAQLNILDHETRLADHFGGKMHLGMVEIRSKHADMLTTIEERKKLRKETGDPADVPRSSSYASRRSPDRRDRERDRGDRDRRDRDRDRGRERRKSRSRSRERRRSRSGDRKSSKHSRSDRDRRDRR